MVLVKPYVILEVVVFVVDLSMVVLLIHPLHPHEPPSVHHNYRDHLLHQVASINGVVLELLLPTMVMYSFIVSSTTSTPSFAPLILNYFPFVV
jgi:hypothetical protein